MCVQTLFSGKSHHGAAWPGDAGLLGRDRRRAGVLLSSALHRPRLSPPGEGGKVGGGGALRNGLPGRGSATLELLAIIITYHLYNCMHYCIITIRYNVKCATIMCFEKGICLPRELLGGGDAPLCRGGMSPVLRAFSTCYTYDIIRRHKVE